MRIKKSEAHDPGLFDSLIIRCVVDQTAFARNTIAISKYLHTDRAKENTQSKHDAEDLHVAEIRQSGKCLRYIPDQ